MSSHAQNEGRYLPGPWALLCGDVTWLLADVQGVPAQLDALWRLLGGAAALGAVLKVLDESDFGFALVHLEAGAERVVVRGAGRVGLQIEDGNFEELVAPVLARQADYALRNVGLPRLAIGEAPETEAATGWLPISSGVAFAAAAEIGRAAGVAVEQGAISEELPAIPSESENSPDPDAAPKYDFLFEATERHLKTPPAPVALQRETVADEPAADPARTLHGEPARETASPANVDVEAAHPEPLIASVPGVARFASAQLKTTPEPATPSSASPSHPVPDPSEPDDRTIARLPRSAAGAPNAPVVKALPCPAGHPNPPHNSLCRICGAPLPATTPITVPRPVLGILRLSTGATVPLDRGAVFGRSPDSGVQGSGDRPHVVQVPSAEKDISRNHLEVKLDGWHVLVADLDSTNGTIVTVPGQPPQRLRPHEAIPITPGTVVNLADEVSFVYEVDA